MMRFSILLLVAILWNSTSIDAQQAITSFSGNILKKDSSSASESITIEDFRYYSGSINQGSSQNPGLNNPAVAFASSAVVPGLGQALNKNWGRAVAYFAVEVAGIAYYLNRNTTAINNEDAYEAYANKNWSPLAYAQWLVDYSNANDLNQNLDALSELANQTSGLNPDFNDATNDWRRLDIDLVRSVEVRTPFIFSGGRVSDNFSHVLQDYGSQQYYELMSKYYQFQPGWQDFHEQRLAEGDNHVYRYSWDGSMITPNFIEGRDRAEEFNNNYRQAGNMLKLLLVNHVISAFDAFFTVKLRNSTIETDTNLLMSEKAFSVTWHF